MYLIWLSCNFPQSSRIVYQGDALICDWGECLVSAGSWKQILVSFKFSRASSISIITFFISTPMSTN